MRVGRGLVSLVVLVRLANSMDLWDRVLGEPLRP